MLELSKSAWATTARARWCCEPVARASTERCRQLELELDLISIHMAAFAEGISDVKAVGWCHRGLEWPGDLRLLKNQFYERTPS
jgi:hypothetical protein